MELVDEWRELLKRHAAVSCALERALQDGHGLGMSEFELLDRMVELDRPKYRVQELADAVHLSQSASSRLVARLERAGLVTRLMCDQDRRGIFVALTEEGRRRQTEAMPTHRAVLEQTLRAPLTSRCSG
ncbi:MarR family winged helix-turn-helix transcriptional regulator [Bailinhaonella thermotolerans]|uniref:MarR family winged helix-turn-helix transcriptional regulator n=1 Tax=Bailinhaonella thermotolerans TaxID=1070861 RepID=UPI001F5BD227|nr:MarR family transcriptional regulator [Bailinhaonella thermotolerans]